MSIIRALVIDDSALMRKMISNILKSDRDIEVIGTAPNGEIGLRKIIELEPDVITLDIEMPVMDGLQLLRELRRRNVPARIIVISTLTKAGSQTAIKALDLGALDIIHKPSGNVSVNLDSISVEITQKIKSIARIHENELTVFHKPLAQRSTHEHEEHSVPAGPVLPKPKRTPAVPDAAPGEKKTPKAVAIGISTGGPRALRLIFPLIPKDFPLPIFVVQHIPKDFVRPFAYSLNEICPLTVKEAEAGEEALAGTVYIAPGEMQMGLDERGHRMYIRLEKGAPISGHAPSVDFLFDSLVNELHGHAIAVIMTGMGSDGAKAIHRLHRKGGITIAQDKDSCTVFGMPRVAIALEAIDEVVPLSEIIPAIVKYAKKNPAAV